jgi:acetyl-CoA acetyltransferase
MALQRYLHQYAIDPARMAAISVTQRQHAELNPNAALRKPLSRDDYHASRFVIEPLRLFDCSFVVDGAVALVLTRSDRARDCRSQPVYLLGGQGIHAGPDEFIFGQPGLGIDQADVFDYKPQAGDQLVYRMAGVQPADIDGLHIYDAFSPQVLWALERFGFCEPGEAIDLVQDGGIGLGGKIPVNTSGGHLSEGHFNGWGHIAEMINQIRGQAGPRQIAGARLVQWATTIGDSLIFGRDNDDKHC